MSPYRVLAVNDKDEKVVLAAMCVVDKKTQKRNIYIISKHDSAEHTGSLQIRSLAYAMTSKKNSNILARYEILFDSESRRYQVFKQISDVSGHILSDIVEYTQAGCLKAALYDWCAHNRHTILYAL